MSDIPSPLPFALTPCKGLFPLTPEREDKARARMVREAMTWIGTPYRQLGATKGIAIDCSMLLARVLIDSAVVEHFDPRPYPPAWFLHRDDERYIDWLAVTCMPIEVAAARPGDFLAFKMGRAFAHSAIVINDQEVVHAFADERICNLTLRRHPLLAFADRRGRPRETRAFDIFARLREAHDAKPAGG